MHIPKKYSQDKLILLLVSITVFVVLLCGLLILLQAGSKGEGGIYIVEHRNIQGSHVFKRDGSMLAILNFIPFVVVVAAINIVLSIRTYRIRRTLAITILVLGILVQLMAVLVSNLLLVY